MGGEFSSCLLAEFCRDKGICQSFTLPASPQQNMIAERCIGLIMEVARTSMIHAAAPHFLWPFAVRYAAHQLNLWPHVSLLETLSTLRWIGQVGDASVFRVWGELSLVRDTTARKLSPCTLRCVFLGFPTNAPSWQFYHPRERRVFSSQDVTFVESICFYRLHRHASHPVPLAPLFLVPDPPPIEPLPPQGPAPSGVSQVDPPPLVEPLEISSDSSSLAEGGDLATDDTAATRRSLRLETPPGFPPWPSSPPPQPVAVDSGAETAGAEPGGAKTEGEGSGGADSGGAASPGGDRGTSPTGGTGAAGPGGPASARGAGGAAGAGGTRGAAGVVGAGAAGAGGVGGAGGAEGAGGAGGTRGATGVGGTGATSPTGHRGAGGAGGTTGAGGTGGASAREPGAASAGGTGAASARGTGATSAGGPVGTGGTGPAGALSQFSVFRQLLLKSLIERREPETRASIPEHREPETRASVRARVPRVRRSRAPAIPGTHDMTLRPSSVPQRVVLPSPPESSLPARADPLSDLAHASSSTVTRFLTTVVTDPMLSSPAASALVTELVDFAAPYRLDYLASLVSDPDPACPPSIRGEVALGYDVLEERQEELECLAAAAPHLATMLLAPEGDPDALDIPTPRSYREAISGTYVDKVPPPGANIVSGMWIFRLKRPPGSPPAFKARYVARGFCQRQGVDFFHTPKMTTLRALQHFGFLFSLPEPTPLSTGHSLSAPPSDESVEPSGPYPQLVGCLITSGMGLVLGGRGLVVLTRHSDASWADDQAIQRSSQGYTFSLGSSSFSWRSTRSSSVLGSSYEAEIYAGAMAAQELRWLTYLLTDLGERPRSSPVLYVNNKAMLALCHEQRLEHRTKHIALRYFLSRKLQQRRQLRLSYVASGPTLLMSSPRPLGLVIISVSALHLGLCPTLTHLLVS
ncbi:unnamed protein product [Closterium sp. NIES-53]